MAAGLKPALTSDRKRAPACPAQVGFLPFGIAFNPSTEHEELMAKQPFIGTCRLCREEAALVDSHIVPAFLFRPLKEVEGRYSILSTDPSERERTGQRGITERLLCRVCDNERLQRYEDHLARVLNGGIGLRIQTGSNVLQVQGSDYRLIKNAAISMLWRIILSRAPMFKEVSLAPLYEERLRDVLLNNLKVGEDEFAVAVTAPLLEGRHFPDWTVSPDFIPVGENNLYRFLVTGLLFTVEVGPGAPVAEMGPMVLREREWRIPVMDVRMIPFLSTFCADVADARKTRQQNKG